MAVPRRAADYLALMRSPLPLGLAWLAACTTGDVGIVAHDTDCGDAGEITTYTDADADGYGDAATAAFACELGPGQSTEPGDCDDQNDDVSPGATERCNEVDDDCDSEVDEDASDAVAVYDDADGDGHGSAATERLACAAGAGEATVGDDCDDAASAVYPGAPEDDCTDPTDYNCDGSVAWADADGDGWAACEDCDDGAAAVNPDATEVCDETDTDEDCSGLADDADPGVDASSGTTFTRDVDADGYGGSEGLTLTQCEPPTGYAAATGDCDDYAAAINPAATELCDEADVDEDCDGVADDLDPSTDAATWNTWYADADSDAHGNPAASLSQCNAPPGHVADATDCDDTSALVNPAATESCNGIDDDCDALVDDADSAPAGTTEWYADTDGDTFGDAASASWACATPSGFVADATDCDDSRADVNPLGTELCDGGLTDEDCDTLVDDDDPSVAGTSDWYADADSDGYGGTSRVAACVAPTGYLATATDCDDTSASVSPAAAEACNAVDDDCDTLVDDDDSALSDPSTWYLDADGDGYGGSTTTTACVEPPGYAGADEDCDDSDGTAYPGATEVCEDGTDQDCDGAEDTCPGVRISGTHSPSGTGVDVRYRGDSQGDNVGAHLLAGDFNGDGAGDLFASTGIFVSPREGLVVGWYGSFTGGLQGPQDYSDAEIDSTSSTWSGANFPTALSNLGDQDGDGIDDIGLHSQENDYPDYPQVVLVYYGGFTGTVTTSAYDESYVCASSADAGNWDQVGGGSALICGDDYRTSSRDGIVEVYAGGSVVTTFTPATSAQYLGRSVAGGDDVDGDGIDDLWFGTSWDAAATYGGAGYLFYGPQTGSISVSAADVTITGSASEYFGTPVSMPGDVDGDGLGDVVGAAYYAGHNSRAGSGSIYVFADPSSGDSDTVYHARLDGADSAVYLQQHDLGDFDGDGALDLVAGSRYDDTAGSSAGAVWLQYGPLSGNYDLASADATWHGDDDGDWLGEAVAAIPDSNGDGFDELAFGASSVDNGSKSGVGIAYVWYGE